MNNFTPPPSPPLEPVPDEVHPPMPILPTPHAYAATEAAFGIVKLDKYNKATDTFRGTWARGPVRASDVTDQDFAKASKKRSQAKAGSSTRRRSTQAILARDVKDQARKAKNAPDSAPVEPSAAAASSSSTAPASSSAPLDGPGSTITLRRSSRQTRKPKKD